MVVDIALVTWPNHPDRLDYLRQTVADLQEKLTASRHQLNWMCSSETERDPKYKWCGDELKSFCDENGIALTWRDGSASCGGNMNAALRAGSGDVVLLHQDDFKLLEPLDISDAVDVLLDNPEVDIVRLSYPDNDSQRPTFHPWNGGWKRIDVKGNWPYGDDPHLRRRDFMRKWGWYKEGRDHVQEGDMLRRLIDGNALILAPDKSYYSHFGGVTALIDDVRWATKTR